MRFNDAVFGIVLLLFAAAVLIHTRGFPEMPGQDYGPALFPNLIALGLAGCGLVLLLQGWRQRRSVALVSAGDWFSSPRHRSNLVLVPAVLVFYILASDGLGFLPTAFLILSVLLVRLGTALLPSLALAAAATVVIHTAFYRFLLVPLPWGLLEPWAW